MPYALELRQRFTPLQNRYDLVGFRDGTETVLGYAEQKRFSLKERITFFGSADKSQVAFTLGARNVLEIAGTYDVQDAAGQVLATIRKDPASSLIRSTYHLSLPGRELLGQERTLWKALFRRLVDLPLFPIQFDVSENGHVAIRIDRLMQLRDSYRTEVADDRIDWRVAAAMTVAVDAFMQR
jgi:uncharacterized protein YxjI